MFKTLFKKLFGDGKSSAGSNAGQGKCCCGCGGKASEQKKNSAPEKVSSLEDLQGFVGYVVRQLVDDPDSVTITVEDGENDSRVIRVGCRKEDTGKIIGKKGKTIIALRSLVASAAGRMQQRISVEVVD